MGVMPDGAQLQAYRSKDNDYLKDGQHYELYEIPGKTTLHRYGLPAPVGYACTTRVKPKKPRLKSVPARG